VIEDDVFIGMQSLILKGLVLSLVEAVTIGRGSVVGAGSVVTRDVSPGVVVAGNPATVVKRLENGQSSMVNGQWPIVNGDG
jgi:acetyltransferase-like isoleucine patch superfamily enzyme